MPKGLGGLIRGVTKAIDDSVNYLENQAAPYVGQSAAPTGPMRLFATGNVVYLLPSTMSSKRTALQILMGPQGLILDGTGSMAPNAHWTVINEGNNKVRLHNQNNFIAVSNKALCLLSMPSGVPAGVETQFTLYQKGQHVQLSSVASPGVYLAIDTQGKPDSTTTNSSFRDFNVQLVYSPYGTGSASPYAPSVVSVQPGPGAPGYTPTGAVGGPAPMGASAPPVAAAAPPPGAGVPYYAPPPPTDPKAAAAVGGAPAYEEKQAPPPAYQP